VLCCACVSFFLGAGYGSLRDVRRSEGGMMDRMESFWLAETLKYTYMLQLDTKDSIDLTKYGAIPLIIKLLRMFVQMLSRLSCMLLLGCGLGRIVMNTEAHPFPILDHPKSIPDLVGR
jgi:hypothetical protein